MADDIYVTNHTIGKVFTGEGWEGIKWPLLATFIVLNLVWYFGELISKCLYKCMPSLEVGDIEIDESIDNYWAALDDGDREWSLKEEENARILLTSKILTDKQYARLQKVEKTKMHRTMARSERVKVPSGK